MMRDHIHGSGALGSVTVTLSVKCQHCSAPVPINGPAQHVHCRSCQRDSVLDDLDEHLALASASMRRFSSPYEIRYANEAKPKCRQCDQVVNIAEQLGQTDLRTTIPCSQCGTGLPTYPAPEWLRAKLPAVRQVFGGDPEVAQAAGLALELEPTSEPKPIAMACPQCAGSLLITAADERVLECRYCSTSVFLPDELWRRLHPAKTMCAWTLTYAGALQTLQAIAEQAREREREQIAAEHERARAVRARDEAEALEAKAQAEKALDQRLTRVAVVAGILVVAVVLASQLLR